MQPAAKFSHAKAVAVVLILRDVEVLILRESFLLILLS
jgi:hypothetical protein